MPSGPLAHICMVVKSLKRAVADWITILSVLDPGQLDEPVVRYNNFEAGNDTGMRTATFVSRHGCEVQLIEPSPDTPLGRRAIR